MLLVSIKEDMIASLKRGDTIRVGTLRFLISAIRNAAIAKYGAPGESAVTDDDVLDAIRKQVKQHKESVVAFTTANRPDLSTKEQLELDILAGFLPKEMSDDDLHKLLLPIAATGEKNFGLLMKSAMVAVGGTVDGGRVSSMLRALMTK